MINEQLLIQWFVVGLLKKIREPLRMHETLRKSQRIESDDDWNTLSVDRILEERIDMM